MKQSDEKPDEEIAVAAQKNEPTPPFENAGESQAKKGFWEGLVSFQGRARRTEFWGVLLATLAVFFPLFCCCVFFLLGEGEPVGVAKLLNVVASYVLPLGTFLAFLFVLAVGVRRFHDVNLPSWICVALFVLLFLAGPGGLLSVLAQEVIKNLARLCGLSFDSNSFFIYWSGAFQLTTVCLILFLGLWPGTRGPNKYGPQPRQRGKS